MSKAVISDFASQLVSETLSVNCDITNDSNDSKAGFSFHCIRTDKEIKLA